MDTSIKLIIHKGSTIFDSVIVAPSYAIRYEQEIKDEGIEQRTNTNSNNLNKDKKTKLVRLNKKGCNAYIVSAYVVALIASHTYRTAAFKKLSDFLKSKSSDKIHVQIIFVKLRTPRKQFLDYKWNERITHMALERREVDHAMSWLSTLGGAFSALGEEFQHCAEIAGKISVKQFELALRVEDPLLVARCKLYAAFSLIQQGRLELPKKIVRNVYRFAIAQKDVRLQNMCQGIWAKLKYCYQMQRKRNFIL